MITHATYLAFASEHRARVAQAERFGPMQTDLPRRPRQWRRSRIGRRGRSAAGRASTP